MRSFTDVDYTRRPVIGILSEPLRGEITKQRLINSDESEPEALSSYSAYIPKAHV